MKGSLEKYLFFNTLDSKDERPRDDQEETSVAARELAAEEAITDKAVYHRLFKGRTATSGDIAAGQKIIKVRSVKGIKGGGTNVGDVVTIVDKKRTKILTGFVDGGVVDSIGSIDAAGFYPITLVANVDGALDYSASITDTELYLSGGGLPSYSSSAVPGNGDKDADDIWVQFSGNNGSNGAGGDKDIVGRAQQACYPVERFKGYLMEPESKSYTGQDGKRRAAGAGVLVMVFEPLIGSWSEFEDSASEDNWDYVFLKVTPGKQKEVMRHISQHINGNRNIDDGFIVVFDDIEKETVSPFILGCAVVLAPNK